MVDQLDERGRENSCFPVEEGLGKPWVSQSLQGGQRHNNLPVADFVLCPSRSSLAARRGRANFLQNEVSTAKTRSPSRMRWKRPTAYGLVFPVVSGTGVGIVTLMFVVSSDDA